MQQAAFRITQPDQQQAQLSRGSKIIDDGDKKDVKSTGTCLLQPVVSSLMDCVALLLLGQQKGTVAESVSSAAVNRSEVALFLPSCPPSYFLPSILLSHSC